MTEPSGDSIEADAIYFDGSDNRRHQVKLRLGSTLEIAEAGVLVAAWPLMSIRRADGADTELRLSCATAAELARLVVTDPRMRQAILARCPAFYAQSADSRSTLRIIGWSFAAAASIVLVTLYGIPLLADRLAPLAPPAFERRIGDMVDGQMSRLFDAKRCENPDGVAAFGKLISAIEGAANVGQPAQARVIRSSVRNAVALPGGRVYLFRGLLDKSESPDEIAGVLAHELGHVRNHDGMRRLIQSGGVSFLIGLLFGDVTGAGAVIFGTQQLLGAAYSREAETRADDVAVEAMNRLGRSPVPAGELLQRITGDQKDSIGILASHPLTGARLEHFKAAEKPVTGKPILDFGEWRALKNICNAKTD